MSQKKLTPKQEKFCREYMVDLNATQAAIRAGYSEKSARSTAYETLSKQYIQDFLKKLKEEQMEKLNISIEWLDQKFLSEATNQENSGSERIKATENLAKKFGYYEKHNEQKNPYKPESPATKKDLPNEWQQ